MNKKSTSSLSLIFEMIGLSLKKEDLTVGEFFLDLGERSHALIIFVFSLPFLTPIPVPELSVIFGGVIMISSFAMIFNLPIKVPTYLSKKNISSQRMSSIITYLSKYLWRLEKIVHPRGEMIIEHFVGRTFICILIFISGFVLALPLPPGTNFPPAFVCLTLSIAMLEKDFVMVIFGSIGFIAMTFFFSTIAHLISKAILQYLDFFRF